MTASHKPPTSLRISRENKGLAKRAARIESKRLKRRIGWSTLIEEGGMQKVWRILRRAEKEKVA